MPIPFRVGGQVITSGLPAKAIAVEPIWVDSQTGSANNLGTSPAQPEASIAGAFSRNRVSTNGLLVCLPGHSESVTAAAGINCDIAGVHVLGLGEGTARPTINFTTAAGADIDIGAANITFENLYFDATGVDALTGPIDVNAAYFTLKRCHILLADSGGQCADFLVTDANADYLTVEDCYFESSTDAGGQSAIQLNGCARPWIRRNVIEGDFAAANIEMVTAAPTRVLIEHNDLENFNAVDVGIEGFAASTGTVRYNTIRIATDGQVTYINTPGSLQLYENYGVNADGETGQLEGTVSDAL